MARFPGRWIVRGAVLGGVCAILVVIGLFAVTLLPQGEGLRRLVAERALTQLWGEPVTVSGAVTVDLWPRPILFVAGIQSRGRDGAGAWVERVVLGLPAYGDLLSGHNAYSLAVDGARLDVPMDGADDARPGSLLESPIHVLSLLPHLAIQHTVIRLFDSNGWLFELRVEELRSRQDGTRTALVADAALNGAPVKLGFAFDLDARPEEGLRPYGAEIRLLVPGPIQDFICRLDVRAPTARFDRGLAIELAADAGSLAQVLVLSGLAPVIDGSGTLRAWLFAEPDTMAVRDLQLDLRLTGGEHVHLDGAVGDLPTLQGVDVKAVATLNADVASSVSLRDIVVTRLSGAFRSGADGLMLEDSVVETNAFDQSFRQIGPIAVRSVERDGDGRVALKDVSVLAGPRTRPVLQLTGDVRDVLRFVGVNLAGTVDLPVASMLAMQAGGAARLGRLVGRMAVSDAGGELAVDAFAARIEGGELVQASIDLAPPDLAPTGAGPAARVEARLDIPNYSEFAAALGREVAFQGPIRFDGRVSGTSEAVTLDGRADIGRTQILGNLTSRAKPNGRVFVGGTITAPKVFGDELISLVRTENRAGRRPVAVLGAAPLAGGSQIDLMATTDMDIAISAERLEGGGDGAKGIQARLAVNEGALRIDPLRIGYQGGFVSAVVASEGRTSVRIKGAGEQLSLAGLVGRGAPISVSGTLRLAFDLTARTDADDMLSTLAGTLTARVGRGRIGTGLLDLAGMGIVGGLFTSSVYRGDSELRCAKVPFVFEKGVARTNPILVVITENIQALGRGTIDLPRNRIDLLVVPRPLNALFGESGHSFTVKGPLGGPSIALAAGGGDLRGRFGCDN
ncbi:AsmA-like C-terminal region-containing protein [Aquabacter spiritensis]|uniref:AsmA-like protein n=1 Tax=Aquabacter spiritensis TaxID=933073 RepID=A0A4R3LXV4_9HYPH|nr:AsmA-like C-terminal region-containing protein [Aquabacter spiritensis]TCT04609.1 AsmA-like protein [Aquabacter spiritensis]